MPDTAMFNNSRPPILAVCMGAAVCFAAACHLYSPRRNVAPTEPEFVFPTPRDVLVGYLSDERAVELTRLHAWKLWAMINKGTSERQPAWLSWRPIERGPKRTPSALEVDGPVQLLGGTPIRKPDRCTPNDTCFRLGTSVFYNDTLSRWVSENKWNDRARLDELNREFDLHDAPTDAREISNAPRASIALKPIWVLVSSSQPLRLPVWNEADYRACSEDPDWAPSYRWKDVVVLSSQDASPASLKASHTAERTVPFDSIFTVLVDDAIAYRVNTSFRLMGARDACTDDSIPHARSGDHLALVGMHVATKELEDWVWATFWWHPDPEVGEYAAQRPDDQEITGVWRNYLMDVTFQTHPLHTAPQANRGLADDPCSNPWLEAQMQHGVASNCISCHQYATWRSARNGSGAGPVSSGELVHSGKRPKDSATFQNAVRLDYMWSLVPQIPK